MTRVRVELCDYEFEIIYKQEKMNTNADALSRIKLNSDMLKAMIPIVSIVYIVIVMQNLEY